MTALLLLALAFALGGCAFVPLRWLLGYRERMRRQYVEAVMHRVIGGTRRPSMRLVAPIRRQA